MTTIAHCPVLWLVSFYSLLFVVQHSNSSIGKQKVKEGKVNRTQKRKKMVESKQSYEECRRKRIEENKKRMEELNLGKLALTFKASTAKSSPAKQVKRPRVSLDVSSVPVRRSSRTANKPPPNYKEVPIEPLGSLRRSYRRGSLLSRFYASDGARQDAIERAEQLESDLGSDFPTFLKPMLQSHVSGGFWLGLPVYFCKEHLPNKDEMITLVDEDEDEFPTKYLAEKNGLSGGWRGFAIDHELVDGDALVFQLINPTTFKVYIIRASELPYDEDKGKDSDASKLDNEDKDKDSDASQLDRIAKRTRASRKRSL
ncbi:B3 domain-containing protein At3g19184 [Quercus suber]|uniref:B3 domain-containing protein At3g19184 n=1 Tax=Quercus suber TaxID=58331 RepID=UPI0032DFAF3C